ncbi:hypothetical protein BS47DRAFT_1399320 [Hydnum rufescens UP504]|uniref:Uncharacterized protein n=1 Tax=Hydnum rufescens UP504 TaxID=1448309 RepID=A0A9P6AIX8_9AGAM|nr:hypothetical protein BS47DRAFT_1399320 [Hydnum rufescens UP504]
MPPITYNKAPSPLATHPTLPLATQLFTSNSRFPFFCGSFLRSSSTPIFPVFVVLFTPNRVVKRGLRRARGWNSTFPNTFYLFNRGRGPYKGREYFFDLAVMGIYISSGIPTPYRTHGRRDCNLMFLTKNQGSLVVPLGPVPRDSTIPYLSSRDASSFVQSGVSSNETRRVIVLSVLGAILVVLALGFLGSSIYRRRRATLPSSLADNTPLSLLEALSLEPPPCHTPRSRDAAFPGAELAPSKCGPTVVVLVAMRALP